MHTVDDAVWEVIRYRESHKSETADLLGLLLAARDEQGTLSLTRVRDEATTFMLAGHETTANALSWIDRHPIAPCRAFLKDGRPPRTRERS